MRDNERILLEGLKALAAGDGSAPPAALEGRLLKALRPRRAMAWPLALEAAAAAAILAIAVYSRPHSANDATGFITVPYSMPIGPNERAELVRVNVPISALSQWGFAVTTFNPDQRVDADVVLGEDGLARAVRLVSNQ